MSQDIITVPIENNISLLLFQELEKILDNKYFEDEYQYEKVIQSIGKLFEQKAPNNDQLKIFLHVNMKHSGENLSSYTFNLTYSEKIIKISVGVKFDLVFRVVCMFSKQQSFVKFIYKTDIPYDWALELFKINLLQNNNNNNNNSLETVAYPNLKEIEISGTSIYTNFCNLNLFQDLNLTVHFPMGSYDKYQSRHDTSYYIQEYNKVFNDKLKQLSKLKNGCINSLSLKIGWPAAIFDNCEPWTLEKDQVKIQKLVLIGSFNRFISAHTLGVLSSIFGNVCLEFAYETIVKPKDDQEFNDISEALMKFKQFVGIVLVLPV